jgi:hypothetical protein
MCDFPTVDNNFNFNFISACSLLKDHSFFLYFCYGCYESRDCLFIKLSNMLKMKIDVSFGLFADFLV